MLNAWKDRRVAGRWKLEEKLNGKKSNNTLIVKTVIWGHKMHTAYM